MTMKKLLLTTMCMLGLAACANGSNKENNTKKENTMKTIALTKADCLTKVANYKVNTEEAQELAAAFGIRSIPTLLFIPTSGKPQIAQGALPKASLKEAIDKVLLNK